MWGILLTLPDSKQVQGVIFDDMQVYLHEPISDSYALPEDVLAAHPGSRLAVTGVMIDLAESLGRLEEDHMSALKDVDKQFNRSKRNIERLAELPKVRHNHTHVEEGPCQQEP